MDTSESVMSDAAPEETEDTPLSLFNAAGLSEGSLAKHCRLSTTPLSLGTHIALKCRCRVFSVAKDANVSPKAAWDTERS